MSQSNGVPRYTKGQHIGPFLGLDGKPVHGEIVAFAHYWEEGLPIMFIQPLVRLDGPHDKSVHGEIAAVAKDGDGADIIFINPPKGKDATVVCVGAEAEA